MAMMQVVLYNIYLYSISVDVRKIGISRLLDASTET